MFNAYLDIMLYSEGVKNATVHAQQTVFSQQCLNFPPKFDLAVSMPDNVVFSFKIRQTLALVRVAMVGASVVCLAAAYNIQPQHIKTITKKSIKTQTNTNILFSLQIRQTLAMVRVAVVGAGVVGLATAGSIFCR